MRRSLWPYVISFLLVAIVIVVSWILCLANPTTTFLIVRHAERADASANTNLSQPGVERAAALAEVAREAGVTAVYSTDYCRTAQTAQPSSGFRSTSSRSALDSAAARRRSRYRRTRFRRP